MFIKTLICFASFGDSPSILLGELLTVNFVDCTCSSIFMYLGLRRWFGINWSSFNALQVVNTKILCCSLTKMVDEKYIDAAK